MNGCALNFPFQVKWDIKYLQSNKFVKLTVYGTRIELSWYSYVSDMIIADPTLGLCSRCTYKKSSPQISMNILRISYMKYDITRLDRHSIVSETCREK